MSSPETQTIDRVDVFADQHEPYEHTQWPTEKLISRLHQIAWAEHNMTHSESRKRQLGHEASCIAFELNYHNLALPEDQVQTEVKKKRR